MSRRSFILKDLFDGGETGIRTLDTLRYTRFPSVRLQPLGHLSASCECYHAGLVEALALNPKREHSFLPFGWYLLSGLDVRVGFRTILPGCGPEGPDAFSPSTKDRHR